MKIIRMGNVYTNRNTCPYCSCEYEYDETDTHVGYELSGQYSYIICPCCGKTNRLNSINWDKQYPPYYPMTPWSGTYVNCDQHIPKIEEVLHQFYDPDTPHVIHSYRDDEDKEDKDE